ncbi:RepB family protein [Escherichia coli]
MSQTENAVTSSSGAKRAYRKGISKNCSILCETIPV